jgi:hypothetical protein
MPVLASSTGLTVEESVVNPPAHALVSALPHALVQMYEVTKGRERSEPTCSCFSKCFATCFSSGVCSRFTRLPPAPKKLTA